MLARLPVTVLSGRHRRIPVRLPGLALLLLTLGAASRALAAREPTRAEQILDSAATAVELRAALLAEGSASATANPLGAGETFYYRGESFERDGGLDSAIASYRRAAGLRGAREDRLALADALLRRHADGDLDETIRWMGPLLNEGGDDVTPARAGLIGRVGWAHFMAGRVDTAANLLLPAQPQLEKRPEWRLRLARVRLASGDAQAAYRLLMPLAVTSRRQAGDVMDALEEVAKRTGGASHLDEEIARQVTAADLRERTWLAAFNGRRARFAAPDGFVLGGVAFRPARAPERARLRPAVLLEAPGDSVVDCDSLITALTGQGFAVLVLEARGFGWSVGPDCPLPDAWRGRETELEARSALDVAAAVRALAAMTTLDTSRVVVVGVGSTASVAVAAAEIDPRVRALVLVSAAPAAVERGPLKARMARLGLPTYFQIGPEDYFDSYEITELLYQAGNRAASRVADSMGPGHRAALFRFDPAVTSRLRDWLQQTVPDAARPRGRRPAPPPSPRHPG